MRPGCDEEAQFDIIIKTQKGAIMAGYFKQTVKEQAAVAAALHEQAVHIKVKRLPQMLGHCGEQAT